MPIFEFHCTDCDKDFEVLMLGEQEICCPLCKGTQVKRLLSAFSHKSEGNFSSSKGASCASCSATSCTTCGSA